MFFSPEIIGLVAATGTTASFVPQAIKIIREKKTQDISLSMYIIFACGIFLWLIYGLLVQSLSVTLANALTLLLVLIILRLKIKYG